MKTKIYLFIVMFVPIFALGQMTEPEFTGVKKNAKTSDGINDPLVAYLTQNFRCPDGTNNCIPEGTAVIQFVVTPEGELDDIVVIESLCCQVDDELIRALKTTNGMWNPVEVDGIPISAAKEVSLMFVTNRYEENPKTYFTEKATAFFNKGNKLFLKSENPQKAIKYYDKSVNYRPNEVATLMLRGLCRYELGDEEGACKDWNRINLLGSTNMDDYFEDLCEMKGFEKMKEMGLVE